MNANERKIYRNKGARMNVEEIKNTIERLSTEQNSEAIWYFLKGIIQSLTLKTNDQCKAIREVRRILNNNFATIFNWVGVPGSAHGERLFQHAIISNKDQLILTILEEPEICVSFASSELRSTPLLLALMNGLSHEVIVKLTTPFSMERENAQGTRPEDTNNKQFLALLAMKKIANNADTKPGFFHAKGEDPTKASPTRSKFSP